MVQLAPANAPLLTGTESLAMVLPQGVHIVASQSYVVNSTSLQISEYASLCIRVPRLASTSPPAGSAPSYIAVDIATAGATDQRSADIASDIAIAGMVGLRPRR